MEVNRFNRSSDDSSGLIMPAIPHMKLEKLRPVTSLGKRGDYERDERSYTDNN